jgi:hypothetical protein
MNRDQAHGGRRIRFSLGEWCIQKVKLYNTANEMQA